MYINNKIFSRVEENDLKILCNHKEQENQRLDFKTLLRLGSKGEKEELLKDIISFANSLGGIIIYGIKEKKEDDITYADELIPMDSDNVIDIANRLIYSSISPGLEFYFKSIGAESGGFYFICYIPQSQNRPHAITYRNKLRWYIRRNRDNFEMTEPEIREMYRKTYSSFNTLNERYEKLDTNQNSESYLSIVAMPVITNLDLINIFEINPKELMTSSYHKCFGGSDIMKPCINYFENTNEYTRDSKINYVDISRIFKSGEIMFSKNYYSKYEIGLGYLYKYFINMLEYFSETYKKFEYYGNVRIWIKIEKFKSFNMKLIINNFRDTRDFTKDNILTYKDFSIDRLNNKKEEISCFMTRCFAQACLYDVNNEYLKDFIVVY